MVHAPEVTDYIKREAQKLNVVSDKIDEVNVINGKGVGPGYEEQSQFDSAKDKATFRRYEEACDRVKNFYAVS